MAFRYDKGTLRPAKRLDNGMLRVDGMFTRTGVFEYLNPDGSIRREYRPPEEVFKAEALESFSQVPFTRGHPPEKVNSKNWKKYAVGSIGENIRKDEDWVIGPITVYDGDTIQVMESGVRELSSGYEIREDWTPGVTPFGERYDLIQRDIRVNHVALVENARAGNDARVRMDSAALRSDEAVMVERNVTSNPQRKDSSMAPTLEELQQALENALADASREKLRADGLSAEVEVIRGERDRNAGELSSVTLERDQLKKARADEKPEQMQAIINGLNQKIAALEKVRADEAAVAPKRLAEAVRSRVSLEKRASIVLPEERLDDLDDRLVMSKVIEKLHGFVVTKDHSMDYIRARFDTAMEGFTAGARAIDQVRAGSLDNPKDREDRVDTRSAREKMVQRNRDAWKQSASQQGGAK